MKVKAGYIFKKPPSNFKKFTDDYEEKLSLWRVFIFLTILNNYFVTTFTYVFLKNPNFTSIFIILVMDLIYFLDNVMAIFNYLMKIKFLQLYLQPTKGISLLITDILLAFPYPYIYAKFPKNLYNYYVYLSLRFIVILRIIDIILFFKRKWNLAGVNHMKYFAIQFVIYFIILLHIVSCMWIFSTNSYANHEEVIKIYISYCYKAVITATNRNFGDIIPENNNEKMLFILYMLFGFIMTTGFFIATISFLLENLYKRKLHLKLELKKLLTVLKINSSTGTVQDLLKKYYTILWKNKSGVEKSLMFEELPYSLKSEICLDLNITFLQTSQIFRKKPIEFLRMLSTKIKYESYDTGELIFRRNVIKNKMIFLVSGYMEILSDDNNESPLVILKPGTCLGESALILSVPSKSSVRAASYIELQILYRKDFLTLLPFFPRIYNQICDNILERVEKTQEDDTSLIREPKQNSFILSSEAKFLKNDSNQNPEITNNSQNLSLYKKTDNFKDSKNSLFISENFPWILNPNGSLYQVWEFCIILISLYISIAYPYFIIFLRHFPNWFIFSINLIDLFLLWDIIILLTTGIENRNQMITSFIKISQKRVLELGFYLDFFSSIKLELFYWIWSSNNRLYDLLRLNRLLKTYRIVKYFDKIENNIELRFWPYQLKHFVFIILSAYLFGNLLYFVTCFTNSCNETGWYFSKLLHDVKLEITESFTNHETLTSIYFSLSSLTGLTPGDILPKNIEDKILTSFVIIFGLFVFGYCIAESSAVLSYRNKNRHNFEHILNSTVKFMKEKNMTKNLVQRVKNYLVLQWNYDQASILQNHTSTFDITKMFVEDKFNIFQNMSLFKGQNKDFLLALVTNSKTLLLPPDEIVTYKGEVLKTLYIIEKGYCLRQFEKSYLVIGPESYFGTMCLFSNVNSLCTVKTITHVKLICIPENIFWKVASLYPTVFTQFSVTVEDFDILKEFKKIPVEQTLGHVEYFENDNFLLNGSLIYLISYCRYLDEDYSEPFFKLGILRWVQLLMVPICFLPYGKFLKLWIITRTVLAILTAVLTPFQVIYKFNSPNLDKIILGTNIIAYIDLYIMMFVGYYKEKNQLVLHPLKTSIHYLKGKFILDFILCFPWETLISDFTEIQNGKPSVTLLNNLNNTVRIIKIGQIYRLFQLINYFSQKQKRKIYTIILRIVKYFSLILIYLHFWATILIANSCKYNSNQNLQNVYHKDISIRNYIHCNDNSWISKSKFSNFTEPYQIYILSIYFCSGILTLSGFGDISPHYLSTLLIVILIIICAVLINGHIYAKIARCFANRHLSRYKYQEIASDLKNFMINENVEKNLQEKVFEQLEYQWQKNQDVDPSLVLSKLYPILQQDIIYTTFEDLLKNVALFENFNQVFLRVFGKIIKEKCYLRQEVIFKANDVVSELCIIEKGMVKTVNTAGTYETFMEIGGIFGNITPNKLHKISVTITALSNVELLVMDSEEFFATLEQYPLIKQVIDKNFSRKVDFIVSLVKAPKPVITDAKLYPDTSASSTSLKSLLEFRANILGFFLICLPWKLFQISIPQYSILFSFFDVYCLILTYVGSLLVIYEFSFQHHSVYLLSFAIYIDFNFIVKILLEMHKSYENQYGEIVTSNKRILEKYFNKKIVKRCAELLTNFPFYYLIFLADVFGKANISYFYFSCLRLLTLFRLFYFFDYYKEKGNRLIANTQLLKIYAIMVWGSVIIHIVACGWYLCACPLVYCIKDSWIYKEFNVTTIKPEDKLSVYLTSVYFTTTILTKTATGDIVASNVIELVYISILKIIIIFLIGLFIGEIWNLLNITILTSIEYNYKIEELKQYVQNLRISEYQLKKLWKYVRQLWFINKGNQIPHAVSLLHYSTFQELMFEVYGYHLKKSYIFSDVEESFARQVCQYLKPTVYFTGNFIVRHGDFDNTMYFIHYGKVEILSVNANLSEQIHEILNAGDMFGVIQGLYYNVSHHFSFRARTIVQVVALRLDDWEYLLQFFPNSKETIYTKTNRVNV